MALFYRVMFLGEPKGPWRGSKRKAQQDALAMGYGSYDDDGLFFLDAMADFAWVHEDQLKLRA